MADEMVRDVGDLNTRVRASTGRGMVYVSDELVLLAAQDIPPAAYYDDYPQIENGVGLLRMLVDSTRDLDVPRALEGKHLAFITGQLAAPYIKEIVPILSARGVHVDVVPIENSLFGPSVTVSGLLSGKDIADTVRTLPHHDAVVLPPNVVNGDGVTLDDTSIASIGSTLGTRVIVGDYDLDQTMKRLDVVFNTE
jgi:NifB/MoaA-like Fe-S oxidoreductase